MFAGVKPLSPKPVIWVRDFSLLVFSFSEGKFTLVIGWLRLCGVYLHLGLCFADIYVTVSDGNN